MPGPHRAVRGVCLLAGLSGLVSVAEAQVNQDALESACLEELSAIAWVQPPVFSVEDPEAIRWPIDATPRFAYAGVECPGEDEFELVDGDGNTVPAQVRITTPKMLVPTTDAPLTIIDVDPIGFLEPRTDYAVIWRPPNPRLSGQAEYVLTFKTLVRRMNDIDEALAGWGGIISVAPRATECFTEETNGIVTVDPMGKAGCDQESHITVNVRYRPIDRPDISYLIQRVRSVPLDEMGEPIEARADDSVIPLVYEPGAVASAVHASVRIGDRYPRIHVPINPMPRRDCFNVVMVDEWGRERGDTSNAICIDLFDDIQDTLDEPCGDLIPDVDPEADIAPPIETKLCRNVGIYGADPERPTPAIGQEPDPFAPDGGGGGEGDGDGGGGSCAVGASQTGAPLWGLALLAFGLRRRRHRRHQA